MANRRRRPSQRSWSRYAAKSVVTGTAVLSPLSFGPEVWLRFADQGLADNDPIATAVDQSGNGNDWTQAVAGSRPVFKTNIVNGHGVARLDGSDDFWGGPDLSALTAGEVFIVLKLDADPPLAEEQTGLWWIGADPVVLADAVPYIDGAVYDGWGSTARKSTGDPTLSLASAFRLYNVVSIANEWTSFIDGTQHFTTGTNTVGFIATPWLGQSAAGASNRFLDGDIAEFVLYNRKLAAGEKTDLKTYFASRYALTIA